jgi:hypothetical protein
MFFGNEEGGQPRPRVQRVRRDGGGSGFTKKIATAP